MTSIILSELQFIRYNQRKRLVLDEPNWQPFCIDSEESLMSGKLQDMETLQYIAVNQQTKNRQGDEDDQIVPAFIIQSHPDLERIGDICWLTPLVAGESLQIARNFPEFYGCNSVIGKPLADPYLSRSPVQLMLLPGGEIKIDCSNSKIMVLVNGQHVTCSIEVSPDEVATGIVITLSERITLLLKHLPQKTVKTPDNFNMVGISANLSAVRERIESLSDTDETVLIKGSTGVGKELVANAIYNVSHRVGKPFVKVSLGAIPSSLAAAELFGAKKGAFTGAEKNREGFFVAADGGTLFLDEVGEASLEVQSLLLRVLETGELYPVGSSTPRKVNVRLITATDANLAELSESGKFKKPLLHRLSNYEIHLPLLSQRKEDIGLLFSYFAKQKVAELSMDLAKLLERSENPWIPYKLTQLLLNYHWPGNIRQLRNITRQLILDSQHSSQIVISEQIEKQLLATEPCVKEVSAMVVAVKKRKPKTVTCEELKSALAKNLWEIQASAESLNISRTSIYELMKRYVLKTVADFSPQELEESYRRNNCNIDKMVADLEVSKHGLTRRLKALGII